MKKCEEAYEEESEGRKKKGRLKKENIKASKPAYVYQWKGRKKKIRGAWRNKHSIKSIEERMI